ncbi:MAG: hypothetical protein ACYDH6_18615 [Acidimicrobiales bacterium]
MPRRTNVCGEAGEQKLFPYLRGRHFWAYLNADRRAVQKATDQVRPTLAEFDLL